MARGMKKAMKKKKKKAIANPKGKAAMLGLKKKKKK